MLRKVIRFVVHEPGPDESAIIRIAMFVCGGLCVVSGLVAATQLHWAALIIIPFGSLILYAWWITVHGTVKRNDSSQRAWIPLQITDRAAAKIRNELTRFEAAERIRLRLKKEERSDGGHCPGVAYTYEFDADQDVLFDSRGIGLVTTQEETAYFSGAEMDYEEVEGDSGFIFR